MLCSWLAYRYAKSFLDYNHVELELTGDTLVIRRKTDVQHINPGRIEQISYEDASPRASFQSAEKYRRYTIFYDRGKRFVLDAKIKNFNELATRLILVADLPQAPGFTAYMKK